MCLESESAVSKGNEDKLCCWLFFPFKHFSVSNSVFKIVVMFTFTLLLLDLEKIGTTVIDVADKMLQFLEEV